ncbi:hypothetical protein BOTBODRAFT_46079 [Botryobasidium botryosum FD-172 SS1]|uniref:F-box domain-containing protein n=1 Tax=Botryobasidium botryosum (strain FD-172 SS1) TaxID=930990 RepID=A0A067MBD6_BOTB1|nr:hypothetical protein BOTBODRAFT_46079 [Botryobasidium botryosum FD-172 SS1]
MCPTTLPAEVHGAIISHISDRADLCNLSMVSRALLFEAERILFRKIVMRSLRDITTKCSWILQRPRLARCIRELSIMSSVTRKQGALHGVLRLLASALRALPALRSLKIYFHGVPLSSFACVLSRPEAFPFRLAQFACNFEVDRHLVSFLSMQRAISDLSLTALDTARQPLLLHDALPNVAAVDVPLVLAPAVLCGPSVSRACVRLPMFSSDIENADRVLAALQHTSGQLQALSFRDAITFPLLQRIAPAVPELRYLGQLMLMGNDDKECLETLARLPRLEVLDVFPNSVCQTEELQLALISRLAAVCPRISRVRFISSWLKVDWNHVDSSWVASKLKTSDRSGSEDVWKSA